jgi:hypothetical protein
MEEPMGPSTEISSETTLEIIAAIKDDNRNALYALLEQHGINCYFKYTWNTNEFGENSQHECRGNAANIAVRLENEALAVELLHQGIEVIDTYYAVESALGWEEGTSSLIENAMYYQMPDLVRELMSRSPGMEWSREDRYDCDGYAAGCWSDSLFLKVLKHADTMQFLERVGLFAGTLNGHLVNISNEAGQFRIKVGEDDLGLEPKLASALAVVKSKVGYVTVDHKAAEAAWEAHQSAAMEALTGAAIPEPCSQSAPTKQVVTAGAGRGDVIPW